MIKGTIIIILFAICFNFLSFGQNKESLEKKKLDAQTTIQKTTKILREVSRNKHLSTNRLRILNKQIKVRENLINQLESEITRINARIEDNAYVIVSLNNDVEKIKREYAKILQLIYIQKPPFFDILYVFSSENFNQAYKRLKYIKQYAAYRKKQVHLINEIQDLLEVKRKEMVKEKANLDVKLDQLNLEKKTVNRDILKQKSLIGNLAGREKMLRREIDKQKKLAVRLEAEIEKLIAEELKKSKGVGNLTPEQKLISDNFENNKGRLPWPVTNGIITEEFGEHEHPVLKHIITRNDGINITSTGGSKARSIFNGVVVRIIAIPGANQTVIIRHGNYLSVYNNLADVFVKVGQEVKTKQEIGVIFTDVNKGNDTTLQFMIWKGRTKLNPAPWLSK